MLSGVGGTLDERGVVFRGVDSDGGLGDLGDRDTGTGLKSAKLFQFFDLFQWARRHLCHLQQKVAAVGIETHVQEVLVREFRERVFERAISGKGDWMPAEVHRFVAVVDDDLDAGRVADVVGTGESGGDGGRS